MTAITKIRKGQRINVRGIVVLVLRREKWSPGYYRVHYGDCGNGFPTVPHGTIHLTVDYELWPATTELEIVEAP